MTVESPSRRSFIRTMGATATLGLAGCLTGRPSGQRTVEMTDDLTFEPADVTVRRGGTVVWENAGAAAHTVTAYEAEIPSAASYFASGEFDSEQAARQRITAGLIEADGSYEHTFAVAGTFGYYCIPHESSGMVGTVRVR